jgi:hypothetical protein
MKNQILGFTLGLTLFGAVITASAQSSLLAGWGGYNSIYTTFPFAAASADPSVSSAAMSYNGLFTINDGRGVWAANNQATTLDVATAPYLAWTIAFNNGVEVTDASFFLNLAKLDDTTEVQLRYSVDNFSSSLGDISSLNGDYQNYVFPLGDTLSGTVTFRLYMYDVSSIYADNVDYNNLYNIQCYSGFATYGGDYNDNMDGYSAGLVAAPVPEPSTLALSAMGGLLLFRRRK